MANDAKGCYIIAPVSKDLGEDGFIETTDKVRFVRGNREMAEKEVKRLLEQGIAEKVALARFNELFEIDTPPLKTTRI